MTYRVEQTTDPAAFLTLAGEHLAADPVLSTVVSTVLARAVGWIAERRVLLNGQRTVVFR